MLNIFKNINKKIDSKIEEYANKNIKEYGILINRPLEGEIVRISNIKIKENFVKPNHQKLKQRRKYYKEHDYFRSMIVLDEDNYLVNGYTTYLLAKEKGYDYITVVRSK